MASILTKELVREAIALSLPTIRLVVNAATWGPKGLAIGVESDYLEEQFLYLMEELGPRSSWAKQFEKDIDFELVVQQKLNTARSGKLNSHLVVSEEPWLIRTGCSFYQGAVISASGKLRVATSGAFGTTDYRCAKIIMEVIGALCSREIKKIESQDVHVF